jgi:NHL repeat
MTLSCEISFGRLSRKTVLSAIAFFAALVVGAQTAAPVYVFSHLAGSTACYGSADGTGFAAQFYKPFGTAVDSAGNIFVADTYNHTIRETTPAGVVTTLAGAAPAAPLGLTIRAVWPWTARTTSTWLTAAMTRSAR